MYCERSNQLRFAAGFQAEIEWPTSIHNFFDDLSQLVNLDRENPFVNVLKVRFGDRRLECAIDRLDSMSKKILEPN